MNGLPQQSALHPRGGPADLAFDLGGLLTVLGLGVLALVVVLLAAGLLRHRGERRPYEPPVALWIGGLGVAMPIVVLTIALAATLSGMAEQARVEARGSPLTIRVVGHRWWWEVRYLHETPQRRLTTANEIVVPVGATVTIELESRDVIHSFWVPNLTSKTDLIPGRRNVTYLRADVPGVYRGQCAEFCGIQHANMALLVIAVPQEEYDAWYEGQLEPPPEPDTDLALAGRQVFLERECAACHAVRGTMALGQIAPDLSKLATRRTLAAGTLPLTRGDLGGWISDPQGIKPGNLMPQVPLDSDEFLALLAYLETLR